MSTYVFIVAKSGSNRLIDEKITCCPCVSFTLHSISELCPVNLNLGATNYHAGISRKRQFPATVQSLMKAR